MTESNTTTTTSAALPRFLDAFFAGRRDNPLNIISRSDARQMPPSGRETEAPSPMRAERGMPGMA